MRGTKLRSWAVRGKSSVVGNGVRERRSVIADQVYLALTRQGWRRQLKPITAELSGGDIGSEVAEQKGEG